MVCLPFTMTGLLLRFWTSRCCMLLRRFEPTTFSHISDANVAMSFRNIHLDIFSIPNKACSHIFTSVSSWFLWNPAKLELKKFGYMVQSFRGTSALWTGQHSGHNILMPCGVPWQLRIYVLSFEKLSVALPLCFEWITEWITESRNCNPPPKLLDLLPWQSCTKYECTCACQNMIATCIGSPLQSLQASSPCLWSSNRLWKLHSSACSRWVLHRRQLHLQNPCSRTYPAAISLERSSILKVAILRCEPKAHILVQVHNSLYRSCICII